MWSKVEMKGHSPSPRRWHTLTKLPHQNQFIIFGGYHHPLYESICFHDKFLFSICHFSYDGNSDKLLEDIHLLDFGSYDVNCPLISLSHNHTIINKSQLQEIIELRKWFDCCFVNDKNHNDGYHFNPKVTFPVHEVDILYHWLVQNKCFFLEEKTVIDVNVTMSLFSIWVCSYFNDQIKTNQTFFDLWVNCEFLFFLL
jgi:hypothetical protein